MKHISILLFVLIPFLLPGQSQKIKNLEASLGKFENLDYIKSKIQLSEWYGEEGFATKAMKSAQNAYEAAKKLNAKVFMAAALNREAKAQLSKGNKRDRNRAENKFRRSLDLLKGTLEKELIIDNLEQLLTIAKKNGAQREIAVLDQQLLFIKGKSVEKILQENEVLSIVNQSLSTQIDSLDTEKNDLDFELAMKRAKIAQMTQAQMQAELMIAQQKNLVDSLEYIKIIDSIRFQQQELILQQNELALKEQETQLSLQAAQKNLFIALAIFIGILAFGLYSRYKQSKHYNELLETKNQLISEEKKRSEELLLNILPAAVAEELKSDGYSRTRQYERATVLFSDFQGFSKISKKLSPEELVKILDQCFKGFDRIITKFGLEKIKTIGDAYMCAGGLPKPNKQHVSNVIKAAFEMQQFLDQLREQRVAAGLPFFEARIGIHTGPLIAGIVGTKKFAYDIWGDTVNVASRMENSCEVGKVNISANTYELIKDQFNCEYRGKVTAKNIGEVDMYYVLSGNAS